MKKVTQNKLEVLYKLYDEVQKADDEVSNFMKKAKTTENGYLPVLREGAEKRVQIKEKDLWTEVYNLGENCNAGKALKEKYPEVFAAQKKQKAIAISIDVFVKRELGLNYRGVKLSDIFRISEAMIEYHQPLNKFWRWVDSLFSKAYDSMFKEDKPEDKK